MVVEVLGATTIPQPWIFYLCPMKARSNPHSSNLELADGNKEKRFLEKYCEGRKEGCCLMLGSESLQLAAS